MNRRALMIAAPLVAVGTLMVGLRIGAGEAVETAQVWTAPPGKPTATGTPYAWQLLTYLEDQGVRETIAMQDLEVVARGSGGEARWTGASNADGIAEPGFVLPGTGPVAIEVKRHGVTLAEGTLTVPAPWSITTGEAFARPTKLEGHPMKVLVEGGRLVPGWPTSLWIEIDKAKGPKAEPEPGLSVEAPGAACDGWAELPVTARAHIAGLELKTTEPDGTWFGALPVAPGALFVGMPRWLPEDTADRAVVVAPVARTTAYVEIDDEHGRVAAAALELKAEPGDPSPRATWVIPPLAAGLHWLVVAGSPLDATQMKGATIARPFLVGGGRTEACRVGPYLAQHAPVGFPRELAIDGMATRGAKNRLRHRIGMAIGLVSLLAAATLETLLLLRAAREAKDALARAAAEEDEVPSKPGGNLTVGLLVALLGFAFLAALLVAKG